MKKCWIIALLVILSLPASRDGNWTNTLSAQKTRKVEDPYALLQQAENIYEQDSRKALDLIEKALVMALRQNDLQAQGESYQLLGDINGFLKQHDLAAANYEKALSLYQKLGNHSKTLEMFKLSGEAYELAENYDQALKNYQRFMDLADPKSLQKDLKKEKYEAPTRSSSKSYYANNQPGYLSEIEEVRLAMSEIYIRQKQFQKSVEYLDEVAEDLDTSQNPEKQILVNDKLGDAYRSQAMDDEALEYYSKNAETAKRLNQPKEEAKASGKIADIYSEKNRDTEALKLRERSIAIYNMSSDSIGMAEQYLQKGSLLNKINQLTASEEALNLALDYSKDGGESSVQRESFKELSKLFEKRGQLARALEFYKKYIALQDEAFKEKQLALEAELELNNSLNKQQQRIDLLEKNEKINSSTIEILRAKETIARQSTKNQRLVIYGLLAVILLLGISGYLMYKNMQRRRVANQLLALKSLRAQMNPHFIFNALNSVNHYISQNDERKANRYLSDFSLLMRAVLEHSQQDFIPLEKELEIVKLYLGLEHNRFSEKFDYTLKIDENLDTDQIKIPPMVVQPYIENAIWHGLRYRDSKGYLLVEYKLTGQALKITVEDNGIGRQKSQALKTDNQKRNSSTGMSNIEGRVSILNKMYNGGIQVAVEDLNESGGTRVVLEIPVAPKPAKGA